MNEQWENFLQGIMMTAQELQQHEPKEDELKRIQNIEDELAGLLDYIEEGRPDTI